MLYPSIKTLLNTTDSRYSLVIAVAKRARQIAQQAEDKGDILKDKPVKIAINEIAQHKVAVVNHEHELKEEQHIKQEQTAYEKEQYMDSSIDEFE